LYYTFSSSSSTDSCDKSTETGLFSRGIRRKLKHQIVTLGDQIKARWYLCTTKFDFGVLLDWRDLQNVLGTLAVVLDVEGVKDKAELTVRGVDLPGAGHVGGVRARVVGRLYVGENWVVDSGWVEVNDLLTIAAVAGRRT